MSSGTTLSAMRMVESRLACYSAKDTLVIHEVANVQTFAATVPNVASTLVEIRANGFAGRSNGGGPSRGLSSTGFAAVAFALAPTSRAAACT